ncbi:hypothetical protein [Thalassobacillus pellis]|uniref:hypothetical protein n=1 Tax=Thalassobacillus pellis TaxID=748008 RepID=UPI001EF93E24|nr:hypothetical protein [Thalassobacillus pellis]MBM7554406.1 hypothetical protein [Thalassobacillus pellis]
MKKIRVLLAALSFAMVIPFSSAHAGDPILKGGNGEWDKVGERRLKEITCAGGATCWKTGNVQSTGGSFRIITFMSDVFFEVWEYDPGSGNDDLVGYFDNVGGDFHNLNGFVDGTNNRAEFYVVTVDKEAAGKKVYFYD